VLELVVGRDVHATDAVLVRLDLVAIDVAEAAAPRAREPANAPIVSAVEPDMPAKRRPGRPARRRTRRRARRDGRQSSGR
jgi:hypothetical protein